MTAELGAWRENIDLGPGHPPRRFRYALEVPPDALDPKRRPQFYFARTLPGLAWAILAHRVWHWRRGDGWRD